MSFWAGRSVKYSHVPVRPATAALTPACLLFISLPSNEIRCLSTIFIPRRGLCYSTVAGMIKARWLTEADPAWLGTGLTTHLQLLIQLTYRYLIFPHEVRYRGVAHTHLTCKRAEKSAVRPHTEHETSNCAGSCCSFSRSAPEMLR